MKRTTMMERTTSPGFVGKMSIPLFEQRCDHLMEPPSFLFGSELVRHHWLVVLFLVASIAARVLREAYSLVVMVAQGGSCPFSVQYHRTFNLESSFEGSLILASEFMFRHCL